MAQFNLGAVSGPIEIPDALLTPLKTRVQNKEISAYDALTSLVDQIESEARAAELAPGMGNGRGYDATLNKYGLNANSSWPTLVGQANDVKNAQRALAGGNDAASIVARKNITSMDQVNNPLLAYLTNTEAPKVYAPGSLIEGSPNSITKEWPAGSIGKSPDQSINPINVNNNNDAGGLAYQERLKAMSGGANNGAGAPATPIATQTPPITTASVQAGIDALVARINKEGITDASGKVLQAPGLQKSATTVLPGKVSASDIQNPPKPITIANSTGNSANADATAAGAEASLKSITDYIKLLTPPETTESSKVKKLISDVETDLNNLKGRGEAQLEAEKVQEVEKKKQTLLNYQTELQVKTAEYKAIQAKYAALNAETEGKPITMNSIIGAQAQVNKMALAELNSKAAEIALVQANVAGSQGNLTLAQDAANRSVDLKYADVKDSLELRLKQLELIQNELSKDEKIRADAITLYLTDQKTALAAAQAYEKDKNATLLNQMQKYPDAGISLNDTIESANQKITQNSAIYQKESTSSVSGTLTTTDKQILLSEGFTANEIVQLESDIQNYGMDVALQGITDPNQKKVIKKTYGGEETPEETRFLSADYFKSIFTTDQLKTAAKEAGFTKGGFLGIGVGERGVNEYIDHLTGLVDQYRIAGYSDKDILKMMQ